VLNNQLPGAVPTSKDPLDTQPITGENKGRLYLDRSLVKKPQEIWKRQYRRRSGAFKL
jgi:hypothetical protein